MKYDHNIQNLRNQCAKEIKRMRFIVRESQKEAVNPKMLQSASLLLISILMGVLLMFSSCHHKAPILSKEKINYEKICEAIYKAEGTTSNFPYGIKTVHCDTKSACADVCIRTIEHYFKDFSRHDSLETSDFIAYTSQRYVCGDRRICPERHDWYVNVNYFLEHPQRGRT